MTYQARRLARKVPLIAASIVLFFCTSVTTDKAINPLTLWSTYVHSSVSIWSVCTHLGQIWIRLTSSCDRHRVSLLLLALETSPSQLLPDNNQQNRAMRTQRHTQCMYTHFKHEKQILCTTVPLVVVWAGCPGIPAVCMCDFSPCDPRLCHWFGNTFSWCPSVQDLRTVWHIQMLIVTVKDCSGQWVYI